MPNLWSFLPPFSSQAKLPLKLQGQSKDIWNFDKTSLETLKLQIVCSFIFSCSPESSLSFHFLLLLFLLLSAPPPPSGIMFNWGMGRGEECVPHWNEWVLWEIFIEKFHGKTSNKMKKFHFFPKCSQVYSLFFLFFFWPLNQGFHLILMLGLTRSHFSYDFTRVWNRLTVKMRQRKFYTLGGERRIFCFLSEGSKEDRWKDTHVQPVICLLSYISVAEYTLIPLGHFEHCCMDIEEFEKLNCSFAGNFNFSKLLAILKQDKSI